VTGAKTTIGWGGGGGGGGETNFILGTCLRISKNSKLEESF